MKYIHLKQTFLPHTFDKHLHTSNVPYEHHGDLLYLISLGDPSHTHSYTYSTTELQQALFSEEDTLTFDIWHLIFDIGLWTLDITEGAGSTSTDTYDIDTIFY